jgi:thiol:disulfide interchange protein
MRKIFAFAFLTTLFLLNVNFVQGQLGLPGGTDNDWTKKIQWSFKIEKIDDQNAFIVGTAKLKTHWHVFSVSHDPSKADLTGYPTKFIFSKSKDFSLVGNLKDGITPKTIEDDLGTSLYFENKAVFKQKIKIHTDKDFTLKFDYAFQICDEKGCIFPPDQTASLKVSGFNKSSKPEDLNKDSLTNVSDTVNNSLNIPTVIDSIEKGKKAKSDEKISAKKSEGNLASKGLFSIFLTGFLFGFVALLTPCVFPMIPMTVSFFTKRSPSRAKGITNAMIYGLSIIVIYVALGLLVTAIMGPTGLNELSTNVWVNLVFFAVFMVFAFSFLGAFEIRMPSSWVNKADSGADKGGLVGIFFMAFTLALVSFSCTGPIIGTSLVEAAASGSLIGPAVIMFGFSLALALPFTLFAIFPGWLNSLPSSGGWLNSVKVVLGLLEIALALKFLSMVDLAYHWNILTREVFVATWFVLFAVMGLYLLGKVRFSHDSPLEYLSVPRFMFAFLALSFAIYLLPGMWGAPLSMIDGVAPPRTHSEDNFRFVRGSGDSGSSSSDAVYNEYSQYMHEVGDGSIKVFHDLDKGRAYAKLKNLPVLVDFTGHACANCRKTESTVWTNDAIRPILNNKFVIVSLYCDDRELLPESEWKYSENIQGTIKNVGNKWSDYQIQKYGQISQPLYIVQDLEGNDLTEAIGYTPNIDEYLAFLEKGIKAFNDKK